MSEQQQADVSAADLDALLSLTLEAVRVETLAHGMDGGVGTLLGQAARSLAAAHAEAWSRERQPGDRCG